MVITLYIYFIAGLLCFIFLFLYLHLQNAIVSLKNQLKYHNQEDSGFQLFHTTSNHNMNEIIQEINDMMQYMDDERHRFAKNEKDIRDMIANISHDIRTPLTSIQGYIEMVQQNEIQEEKDYYYHIITQRLSDLEGMLDEFFLYTKLMNSTYDLVLESKEVYPLLCRYLLTYIELLQNHDLEPRIICDNESLTAKIHEESFKRICTNLIINTARYGVKPFLIIIKQIDDSIMITFQNQVENAMIDTQHMFDRFYKGDKARTMKGSGLGLAIVKELSMRMHGDVFAELQEHTLSVTVQLHA